MHSVKLYVQRSHHLELSSSYEKRSLSTPFPSINDGFHLLLTVFIIIIINMDVRVSLCISQLITRILKLTIM
jgi:hypothetical protein